MTEREAGRPAAGGTASQARSGRGPLRMAAAVAIFVLSATGFLLLAFTEDLAASGSSLDDLSSSGDFLQPEEGSGEVGVDRLRYQTADDVVPISNGGVAPLSNGLQLAVSVEPYPPTNFDIEVNLELLTAAGQPIADADISTVWDMAVMHHGPFDARFANLGNGSYQAPFDLFMVGPWELVVQIEAPGFEDPEDLVVLIYVWPE